MNSEHGNQEVLDDIKTSIYNDNVESLELSPSA
jgi:hypothetical protein